MDAVDVSAGVATPAWRLAAIATKHCLAQHHLDTRHPAVRDMMRSIRRAYGLELRRAQAATTAIVRALLGTCGDDLIADRNWLC